MRIPCPTLLRATLFVLLAMAATLPAQAQWKWRDKSGHITASDLPPPHDIPDKDVLQRPDATALKHPPPVAASAPALAPRVEPAVDKDLEARRRASEAEKQAKARVDEEKISGQRVENCRRARSQLSALGTGQRIARTNEKGEREILDDKGRADETRRANDIVASDCK